MSDVNVKVMSYSIKTCHRGREASVFTIGLFRKEDSAEIWRVEKSLSDLILLDSTLKQTNPAMASHMKRLPEKSLFASHAPAKVDERKDMIEEYLQQMITLKSNDSQPLLQDFLSSDRIQQLPITLTNDIRIKQGYLTKKGKKIGGWKARYFVLENTGALKYYESKNGAFIGTIKLSNSQVSSQTQFNSGHNDSYRHAFFIFDPKPNASSVRHVFCADSDQERDAWIDAIYPFTSQTNISQDIIDHCFADDKGMDQFFVEPSPTGHNEMPPPPPAKDIIPETDPRQTSVLSNTTKSNSPETGIYKVLSAESSGASSDETNEDKKSKQKANRRSFWSRKVFGSTPANDLLPPISPQNPTYDYNHIQILSDLEETRGDKQVFGIPLVDAVALSRINDSYDLPAIVHRCIEYLETKDALYEEGIYRLSGSSSKVKALKKRFNDAGDIKLLEDVKEYHDIHAIAGLLKMWLRELPENVLTEAALPGFLDNITDKQDRSREIRRLISLLPSENYTLLRSLCAHLIRVIENSDKNKMTLRNICIVFSATLGIPSIIFTMLLVEFDYIFWTDRCSDDEREAALDLEDTINSYMQTPDEQEEHKTYVRPIEAKQAGGLRRNSIHYQDSAPKEFISLEKQLEGKLL
ncbi:RhoGAP domain protein [Choanephora cucurbitarum]|nr:RhoGAP domain protein [Choanephora cucurbitarum]